MSKYNFIVNNIDTDGIIFSKEDNSPFDIEEQERLLNELNSNFPDMIRFENDGYFKTTCIIKTKNYILEEQDGSLTIKGSALKATTKSKALQEFIKRIIDVTLNNKKNYKEIYEEYVKEILEINDMTRWVSRKTVTEKIFSSERTNETKVKDIIEDTEYVEGDRIYCFFKVDGSLDLLENFTGEYCKSSLLKALYSTAKVFEPIINIESNFTNYSLTKHFNALCPEQALIKKQLASDKRKEAKLKKENDSEI